MNHVQSRLSRALSATLTLGVASLAVAAPAQADPPGNNGTVKVAPHGEVDGIPQNTPHLGCGFDVEWYGFDEGEEIVSEVTFEYWAPTAVPMTVDGPAEVFVGEDPATGAGTGTDEEGAETDDTATATDETEQTDPERRTSRRPTSPRRTPPRATSPRRTTPRPRSPTSPMAPRLTTASTARRPTPSPSRANRTRSRGSTSG